MGDDLKKKLIKMASNHPELRADILPLLKAMGSDMPDMIEDEEPKRKRNRFELLMDNANAGEKNG